MTGTTPAAVSPSRAGSFRLGGTVFGWWTLGDESLSAWVHVQPESLGEPDTGAVWLSEDFLALAASKADDDAVQVLSTWSVFQPEFDWPVAARECGCLEERGFPAIARELNGDALVPSPGPVFDHFLLKASLLDDLALTSMLDETTELPFNLWAGVVGVDRAFFAPAFVDLGEPTTLIRRSSQTHQTGEAHEAYLRAFDAYYYGGLPARLGKTNKKVYLDTLESQLGYSFDDRDQTTVVRSLSTINSMRMTKSFCCTSLETRGAKVFASRLEKVAESTTFA